MSTSPDKIQELIAKAKRLGEAHKSLRGEFQLLQEANNKLLLQLEGAQQEKQTLQEQLKMTRLAKSIAPAEGGDKAEIKRKINEFIREIDKCVALLNQ